MQFVSGETKVVWPTAIKTAGVLSVDAAGHLVFDAVLVHVAEDAEIVLSEQIRHSILQVTHG